MWFPASQYHPGQLRWNTRAVIELQVRVGGESLTVTPSEIIGTNLAYWSLQPGTREQIEIDFKLSPDNLPDTPFAWLEWVRQDGNVETIVWCSTGQGTVPSRRLHAHNFGSSYRLVVDASRLKWNEDRVYRKGSDSIRFITGSISGHSSGTPSFQLENGSATAVMSVGPQTYSGRVIEIVAGSSDLVDAQTRCGALLGFLGLVFGPAALGNVIFEAAIDAPLQGGFETTMVSRINWNTSLPVQTRHSTWGWPGFPT